MSEEFVPKVRMEFDELHGAYDFYCDYAKVVDFSVRKGRKRPQVQWFYCN
jgi:hypothetical protein